MRKLLACTFAALLLAACSDSAAPDTGGGDSTPRPSGPPVHAKGVWDLRSGSSPSGPIEIPPEADFRMEVGEDGIRGTTGCNEYGAAVSIEGDSFEAGGVAVTEVGCSAAFAEAEERFVEALEAADTIARDGETLTLTGPDAELVFQLVPPLDPKPLTGTVWVLETLLDGDEASSTAPAADPARLLLEDDGTFRGTTGCRSFSGTWTVAGDVVSVTQMVFKGHCKAAAPDEQDSRVAATLAAGFRAERRGDRLRVTAARTDAGLVYRAR